MFQKKFKIDSYDVKPYFKGNFVASVDVTKGISLCLVINDKGVFVLNENDCGFGIEDKSLKDICYESKKFNELCEKLLDSVLFIANGGLGRLSSDSGELMFQIEKPSFK